MLINCAGTRYHVQISGKGEPLLCLHGFTGTLETWAPFIKNWDQHFQVIQVDLIGHGKSDHPAELKCYSMEKVVHDLLMLLDELSVHKVHVLGYSMGGRVALSLAALHPNRIKTLVLESSTPGLKTIEAQRARRNKDEALAQQILVKGIAEFVSDWENTPLFASQKRLATCIQETVRQERLRQNEVGLANSLRGMGTGSQPSWWDELAHMDMPVFLITGELDLKFCSIAANMSKTLPNAETVVVKDAGHAIHVEKPKLFGKIVIDWLLKKIEEDK